MEVLALVESQLMNDGTSDDDYSPEELVEVVNALGTRGILTLIR